MPLLPPFHQHPAELRASTLLLYHKTSTLQTPPSPKLHPPRQRDDSSPKSPASSIDGTSTHLTPKGLLRQVFTYKFRGREDGGL